jgi:hypothetical protein
MHFYVFLTDWRLKKRQSNATACENRTAQQNVKVIALSDDGSAQSVHCMNPQVLSVQKVAKLRDRTRSIAVCIRLYVSFVIQIDQIASPRNLHARSSKCCHASPFIALHSDR